MAVVAVVGAGGCAGRAPAPVAVVQAQDRTSMQTSGVIKP
jgi:hypothetical protein